MRRRGRPGGGFEAALAGLVDACETGLDLAGVLAAACVAARAAGAGRVSAYAAVDDARTVRRIAGDGPDTLAVEPGGEIAASPPAVLVPMVSARRTLGCLLVDGGDASRLRIVAGIAAQAVEVSRLWERAGADAGTDLLTGLPGHRGFHDRLAEELSRARRSGAEVAIAVVDIDGLERVNGERGHAAGDGLLRTAARCFGEGVRGYDCVCRLGPDEFGLVLPGMGPAAAGALVGRLAAAFAASGTDSTVSGGVAGFPAHAGTQADLVRLATGALYWAKRDGGGRVVVYDPAVVEALSARERAAQLERDSYRRTVRALEATRSPSASARATSEWAGHLGARMGLPPERVDRLRLAAFLYDAEVPAGDRAERARLAARVAANALDAEAAEWLLAPRVGSAPLEARVIAVAAGFVEHGGHTSRAGAGRALAALWQQAGETVDGACVRALEGLLSERQPADEAEPGAA